VLYDIVQSLYLEIVLFVAIGIITGLAAFFKNLRKCLNTQNIRTLRMMKAMQVLASEIDKQSIRNHPKEVSTFADDVDRILKDEHGEL
jgi:hypothetical protein